ncbi:hypothetical protein SAMN05421810_106354 [Amycolatopsis arida]|uniref:Uncharacterized protein n=1 Tax=Amycolatopsis arida TaxID=587909 RepID=A0A1I5Y0P9_9PSEU|nr:hypothetical protein [Amycolatopsis arida]TDX97165.1 hypothetical protein CLV69_102268 [Amycolatopsis arida]SFQ37755.1 hypothetical protein SAMN05421810_106354 [Amycolatopsis arida]
MSWSDFYRRRDVMAEVLRRARHDPAGPLPFAEVPGAVETFGTPESLLLALQHRWTQLLSGQLRAEVAGPEDAADLPPGRDADQVDAVGRAWHAAVREHPTLAALLDAHGDRHPTVRAARRTELGMLAVAAGLAEPYEPAEDTARVGAALRTLLRHQPDRAASRWRHPVDQLLRKLAPTA